MMADTFSQALLQAGLTLLCTLVLIFVMTDFRFSRKTCLLIIFGYFIAATSVNGAILYFTESSLLVRYFLITTVLPCVILLAVLAKDDIFKAQFNFWTQLNVFFAIVILSYYGTQVLGGGFITELVLRLTLYVIVFFLYMRFLRRPFRLFAETLETDWVMISFIPFLFFILIISLVLFPTIFYERPWVLPTTLLVYLTMIGVYVVIFVTFKRSYDLLNVRKKTEFLDLQINQQKRQFDIQQQKMEVVRIYRHDMRHHIGIITAFLQDKMPEKAEAYAKSLKSFIDETAYCQFCENYLINTLLSLYTELSAARGIRIETKLSISKDIFVEDTDLCVIFSNALENALNACMKLPISDNPSIDLICHSYPEKLVLEISNSFDDDVNFNASGFPINLEKHHGIGTKSIEFIVKKYNGSLLYKVENHRFILQLLLQCDFSSHD